MTTDRDETRMLGDRYEIGAVIGRGGMAEVQANIAKLPETDIRAIAETSGIPARVIIFTTDLLDDFSNAETSVDPSDYAQVLAIQ